MNEYRTLLNILLIFLSTQIICTYLSSFHNQRKSSKVLSWLAWGLYVLFHYWVMASNASQPLIILIVNIILTFMIYKSSYRVNNKTALFLSGILYAIWMLVEVITSNLLQLTNIKDNSYFFMVGSTVSEVAMYIAVHILKRHRKSSFYTDIPFHYWLRLFLIPVATFYIIHNTYSITSADSNKGFFTVTTMLMILVNYVTFDVYDKLGNNSETEKRNLAYEQQIALCNKQAAEREAAYQETRRIRHDLNGYLLNLKASIQSGNTKEAETKIDYILEHNQIHKNEASHSGNLVIDSLINYKYSLAQNSGIDMKCHVFVPEQMPYDGADLCIILGNLLDNAMEAVNSLTTEQRHMDISISQIKNNLSIVVQNPYEGNIRKNHIGQIMTSKQDKRIHGIGLDSVQRTVEKYNGELLVEYINGLFKVNVLLYQP